MIKRIAKHLFRFTFYIFCFFFILSSLIPYLNAETWWFLTFIGLLYPFLCLILLAFIIFWAIKKSKLFWVTLLCSVIGFKSIVSVIGFHPFSSFSNQKTEGALRIMTWNTKGFAPDKINADTLLAHRTKLIQFIAAVNPDVIALQEFSTIESWSKFNNITAFCEAGYTYHYFPSDFAINKHHFGSAILSKYPIINAHKVPLPILDNQVNSHENLIAVDILFGADTISVYSAHLQSYRFERTDYENLSVIKNDADKRMEASKQITNKMKDPIQQRVLQTAIIKEKLEKNNYPEIFCADMNEVPNSFPYYLIKGDKKDAFLQKGFGFGQTFYSMQSNFMQKLPLRIDYILADPEFEILQTKKIWTNLSDHIPVVADIKLNRVK